MGQASAGATATATATGARPQWSRATEIPSCVLHRPHLARTALTAAVVGTVLFLVNHLATVLAGGATTATWVATGVSFVVPFCVANTGLVVACRRAPSSPGEGRRGRRHRDGPSGPTWAGVTEIPRCVVHRRHLARTLGTAAVVGTVYFGINQLPTVLSGGATTATWVASGVTYLVPFCVANMGLLVGARRPQGAPAAPGAPGGRAR